MEVKQKKQKQSKAKIIQLTKQEQINVYNN